HRLVYAAQQWLRPVVELTGVVDELLDTHGLDVAIARNPGQVDVAVNLHGNGPESRGRLEALQARSYLGHRAPGWEGPAWQDGIHERVRWTRLLRWHGLDADPLDYRLNPPAEPTDLPGAVVIHPGAAYGSRHWPVERFAAVASALARSGHRVVLTGSSAERPRAAAVAELAGLPEDSVVAGRQPLDRFAALIAGAALVVSADTGAAHLATAYRRPSVVIFGPAPVAEWGPPEGPHIVLTDESLRVGDTFSALPDPALLAVTAEDVLAAASRLGLS
ncbi:glycosyltransferase family 9 protein, partial [Arthrobacter deserti]|nr:glycosyltransferase family 9 protein [Arthrobacter deserti]